MERTKLCSFTCRQATIIRRGANPMCLKVYAQKKKKIALRYNGRCQKDFTAPKPGQTIRNLSLHYPNLSKPPHPLHQPSLWSDKENQRGKF